MLQYGVPLSLCQKYKTEDIYNNIYVYRQASCLPTMLFTYFVRLAWAFCVNYSHPTATFTLNSINRQSSCINHLDVYVNSPTTCRLCHNSTRTNFPPPPPPPPPPPDRRVSTQTVRPCHSMSGRGGRGGPSVFIHRWSYFAFL